MKYTEKIHAKRLLGMLEKKDPCACCASFLGLYPTSDCPCCELQDEAVKRTWITLEEKGYTLTREAEETGKGQWQLC